MRPEGIEPSTLGLRVRPGVDSLILLLQLIEHRADVLLYVLAQRMVRREAHHGRAGP
jgi:hypothetical protein